jgi:hypothetical protein
MHDTSSTNSITLKWLQTPGYSSNVKLDISSDLQAAVTRLAKLCFIDPPSPFEYDIVPKSPFPYTPLTYYYVFQSVVKRCVWVENSDEKLFSYSVDPSLCLTWLTLRDWLNGEPVQMFTCTFRPLLAVMQKSKKFLGRLYISETGIDIKAINPTMNTHAISWESLHSIDHLCWSSKNATYTHASSFSSTGNQEGSLSSFLLVNDDGFIPTTEFLFAFACNFTKERESYSAQLFRHFESRLVVNLNPFFLEPRIVSQNAEGAVRLHVIKCLEFADRYELDIGLRGILANDLKGSYCFSFVSLIENSSKNLLFIFCRF